jgi:DNA-binding GntR family transcriptional regulator
MARAPAAARLHDDALVVRTLADRLVGIVRERIVRGDLGDGAQIRQDALAGELGVSKIPLREALARLEHEGLLVSHANRGYFVPPRTRAQADEIFVLRLSLEPAAAAYAARHADAADQGRARAAFAALEVATRERPEAVAVCNREFHMALVRTETRALTADLVERLSSLAERYVVAHLQPAGRDARADAEHREILAAWLERDEARVTALLARHIEGTRRDLLEQLPPGG